MSVSLTIAIPYHSGIPYLEQAVASVLAQDDPEWKLLVVDDSGGDPDVRALVERLGDRRVRLLVNPRNLGMVPCWNRCLDEARGDLVTLLHADDLLRPGYVRTVRALAAEHPEAVALFTGADVIDAAGAPKRGLQDDIKRVFTPRGGGAIVLRGEQGLRAIMRGNFIMCPTLSWRRARLGVRRFDTTWRQVQDLDITARMLLEGETLVGARERVYAYRRHDENATARQTESLLRFREEFRLFDRVAERAARLGWRRAAATSRRKGIVRLHLLWRTVGALLRGRPAEALRTLAFLTGIDVDADGARGGAGLAGATGGALLATIVGLGLMFLLRLALARILGVDDFGALVYVLAWSEVLALLAPLGFDKLLVRELAGFRASGATGAARGILRCAGLAAALGTLVAVAVLLGARAWLPLEPAMRAVFPFALLLVPLRAWGNLRHGALLGLSRPVAGMLATSVTSHAVFLAALLVTRAVAPGLLDLHAAAWMAVGAWAVAAVLAEAQARATLAREGVRRSAAETRPGEWLAAALPMVSIVALAYLSVRADTLMLGAMLGQRDVGVYENAAMFAVLVRQGLVAVQPVVAPLAVGARDAGQLAAVARRATRLAFLPAAAVALGLVALGYPALLLFGREFAEGYGPMLVLAGGFLVVSALGPVETILLMKHQQRFAAVTAGIACALNLALNALLIPRLGVYGAALATAVSLVGWGLAMSLAARARLGLSMHLLARDPDPGGGR